MRRASLPDQENGGGEQNHVLHQELPWIGRGKGQALAPGDHAGRGEQEAECDDVGQRRADGPEEGRQGTSCEQPRRQAETDRQLHHADHARRRPSALRCIPSGDLGVPLQ